MTDLVIWRYSDGKPGHDNQTLGLVQALGRLRDVAVHHIKAPSRLRSWLDWLSGQSSATAHLPDPDLILGAGHSTHVAVLAARGARGGRAVVCMKPSLPLSLFDRVIVPMHDEVEHEQAIQTWGVLNRIQHSLEHQPEQGLILLGGPSKHHGWDDFSMLGAVEHLVVENPNMHWTLTTSRRTPDISEQGAQASKAVNMKVVPFAETGPDWLPQQLAQAGQVWVTEDSVSMVYEALSSGAAVGVIPVPREGEGRVTRGVDILLQQGLVTGFEQWQQGRVLQAPEQVFNESERVAHELVRLWFSSTH